MENGLSQTTVKLKGGNGDPKRNKIYKNYHIYYC